LSPTREVDLETLHLRDRLVPGSARLIAFLPRLIALT
jgi:hypothetical protein